jgi:hypothetical protein
MEFALLGKQVGGEDRGLAKAGGMNGKADTSTENTRPSTTHQ